MIKKLCLALDQNERKMAETGCRYGESEKGPQPGCILQAEPTRDCMCGEESSMTPGCPPPGVPSPQERESRWFSADKHIESCETVWDHSGKRGQTRKRRGLKITRDLVEEEEQEKEHTVSWERKKSRGKCFSKECFEMYLEICFNQV